MGEYGKRKSDGQEIKFGTCESMYYLRYEDREKVESDGHSLDPSKESGLFWRLPFPDEDGILPGNYKDHGRGHRLYKNRTEENDFTTDFSDPSTVENPGIMQLTHPSGLLVNVTCYHGEKLPEGGKDIRPFWNGRSWFYELAHIKNTETGIFPIVKCRHCGQMWRYSWDEVLPFVQDLELRHRLEFYSLITAKN